MKAFIVYCHPAENSFTREIRDAFTDGLTAAGHEALISDLYKMQFQTDLSGSEYEREAHYRDTADLAPDVLAEQEKINAADAIVFIYPVFWTEAPAKLVGWFDRVWSYGFAYGEKRMKQLEKALVLCVAGNRLENLEKYGLLESMKKVMLGDRLFKRVRESAFMVCDGMTKADPEYCRASRGRFLDAAYQAGFSLFSAQATEEKNVKINLNGRFFTAVENSSAGEVGGETVFSYHQKNKLIWAEYAGGSIQKGFLLGKIGSDNRPEFKYLHINVNGEQKSGSCVSVVQRLADGKIRLLESWQWDSGEAGTSVLEEA